MRLRVNGKDVELAAPTALLDYLGSLGVDPRAVAVEVNERILERSEFATTTLREDDVVEIVRMVGGGLASPPPYFPPRLARKVGRGRPANPKRAAPPRPRPAHPTAPCRRR